MQSAHTFLNDATHDAPFAETTYAYELTANPTYEYNEQLVSKRCTDWESFKFDALNAIYIRDGCEFLPKLRVLRNVSARYTNDNFPETNRGFVPEKWSDNYGHDCRELTRAVVTFETTISREKGWLMDLASNGFGVTRAFISLFPTMQSSGKVTVNITVDLI